MLPRNLAAICAALLASALAAAGARAADTLPWESDFLTAPPAEVLRAADAVTASAGVTASAEVVYFLEEALYTLSDDGRCEERYRLVFRVNDRKEADSLASFERTWSPWHEERPVLRARVITRDGKAHDLDAATIEDAPAGEESRETYGDRRVARAPLPAMEAGAVVEEEVTIRESAPYFAAGRVQRFYFGSDYPIVKERLILDSPARRPFRWEARVLPGFEPASAEADGRARLTFERASIEPRKRPEMSQPPEVPLWPCIAFTSGASWAEVARAYSDIVNAQIARGPIEAFAREAAGEPAVGAPDRIALLSRISARLSREVRYTAVELGAASIVPRPPAETLRRRYGDCKDKATLLVACLRAASVTAAVALLDSGDGEDMPAGVPGLGGFDHAIVLVPGDPPLWIDPTSSYARPGELPVSDCGRLALVAAPGTDALVRTPECGSESSTVMETREYTLEELGAGTVTETSEPRGSSERGYRRAYDGVDRKESDKNLLAYVKTAYGGGSLGATEWSDPRDLSTPFRLRIVARDASWASTDGTAATVTIDALEPLLHGLPDDFAKRERGARPPTRTADFFLDSPYEYEVRCRIHAPPGYEARRLPPARSLDLGPAHFEAQLVAEPGGGTVTARFRFTTGPRRMTAAAFEAMRKGVASLREEKALSITFSGVGEAHLQAGRIREALIEFRRLAALHPGEARHHTQTARALLQAGLGEAARAEARLSTEVEPGSAWAWRVLGTTLEHDLVGRACKPGFDPDGAIAAFREAKRLAPQETSARQEIGLLLELDASGRRYGPRSRLPDAIAEYQSLRADLDDHAMDQTLAIALFYARRFEEAEAVTRELKPGAARDELLVASIAAARGPEAALSETAREIFDPAARRAALVAAPQLLIRVREYPTAATLVAEAALGAPNAAAVEAWASSLRKVHRREELPLPDDDPISVVKRLSAALLAGDPADPAPLLDLFTEEERARMTPRYAADLVKGARAGATSSAAADLPPEVMLDSALGVQQFTKEGDDATCWVVRVQAAQRGQMGGYTDFVVRRGASYKVAAINSAEPLGLEVLRRAEAGDLAGARGVLDRARGFVEGSQGDDPLSGPLLPRFWRRGQAGTLDEVKLAGAALAAEVSPERALAILEPATATARADAGDRIDLAIARALLKLRSAERLLPVAERLSGRHPTSVMAFLLRTGALLDLGRTAEVRIVASVFRAFAEASDGDQATRVIALAAEHDGDFAGLQRMLREIVDAGRATAVDYNQLAWVRLFDGGVRPEDLDAARSAVDRSRNPAAMHTLAALYAEVGKCAEAREMLLREMDAQSLDEPGPNEWYVLGRIAEQYGEAGSATAAYERALVTEPGKTRTPTSCEVLAERRLATLRAQQDPAVSPR